MAVKRKLISNQYFEQSTQHQCGLHITHTVLQDYGFTAQTCVQFAALAARNGPEAG
jgi:hypothetical protein